MTFEEWYKGWYLDNIYATELSLYERILIQEAAKAAWEARAANIIQLLR
jgi:hypothetical protein